MKRIIVIGLIIICIFCTCACGTAPSPEEDSVAITDMLGRETTVPVNINRVVCVGAGCLRLYSYIGDLSKLCGVESCEYGFLISQRPYQMINEDLFKALPSVGTGGPQGSANAEAILTVMPDVIFSTYTSDSAAMDRLQSATGIPVVVLSYGKTEAFDDKLTQSIALMGQVLGREERAAEVTDYIGKIKADLQLRTADIKDEEKPTVYLGCQSNYGTHGIGSSTANYSLFNAVNAKNVLDLAGYSGYQGALDLETVATLNPNVIILDAGGLSILKTEYTQRKAVFDGLSAFSEGNIYVQMPYNAYYTNLEIAYANAYYIGKVLYPTRFSDVIIENKFAEICTALLGEDCYTEVAAATGGYRKATSGDYE